MATCPSCREIYPDDVTSCTKDGATLVPDALVAAIAADSELKPGDQVGEYRVEAKIGEGGFGAVYRAVHPVIGKTAAVKLLHRQFSSSPQMVSRFIAEAKAVNQIRHKNIIDIFAFGALPDGRQYYVMELLEGLTFDRYVKQRGRLPVEEALPILRGVARALDAAHAAGIVHRDLKPENVFVQFDEDGVATPKLLDFGIAKLLGDSEGGGHKTRTGTPMGTPYYMSPEQCHGRAVDHRTDVYSFGVMTHEVLTGRVVFEGESVMDVLFKHANTPPPRLSERCPELPPGLDEPVLRMLAKEPADRPATLMEALDGLALAAREAGFNVAAPQPRMGISGGAVAIVPPARVSDRGVVITPSGGLEKDTLAQAQTLVGVHPALMAGDPPGKSKRSLAVAAAVAVALVAAVAIGFNLRPSAPTAAATQLAVTAPPALSTTASAIATASLTAPITPTVTPSGAGQAGPAVEPDIDLEIQSTPAVVDVLRGGDKIGTSAAPIKLKRGEKVKLTFRARGYADREIEVEPAAGTPLQVKLVKSPTAGRPTSEIQW